VVTAVTALLQCKNLKRGGLGTIFALDGNIFMLAASGWQQKHEGMHS